MNVIVRIPLRRRGGGTRAWTTVDAADAPRLLQRNWFLSSFGYAFRTGWNPDTRTQSGVLMAREIMGNVPGDGLEVDHINANKLDNRRANLRQLDGRLHRQHTSSHRNSTSAYRGVCWDRSQQMWMAYVNVDYRNRHLGRFADELVAAHVARAARLEAFPYSIERELPPVDPELFQSLTAPRSRRWTHCKHGHEFTPENTCPSSDGRQRCRTCDRLRHRARRAARAKAAG